MKIKPEDYKILKDAVSAQIEAHPEAYNEYQKQGLSFTRFIWDALWASKLNIAPWYAYLNDVHIDSALKQVMRDLGIKPFEVNKTIEGGKNV